jgi:hypothetical protein
MKERTKTIIDGLCMSTIAVILLGFQSALIFFCAVALLCAVFKALLTIDAERVLRRKNHDAGTHDYYGNKIEEDEKQ